MTLRKSFTCYEGAWWGRGIDLLNLKLSTRWRCAVKFTPQSLSSWEKNFSTQRRGGWAGPRAGLHALEKRKNSCPSWEQETRLLQQHMRCNHRHVITWGCSTTTWSDIHAGTSHLHTLQYPEPKCMSRQVSDYQRIPILTGACDGAVGWGTALQAGRLGVQFVKVSPEFFIDIIFLAALWLWGQLSL